MSVVKTLHKTGCYAGVWDYLLMQNLRKLIQIRCAGFSILIDLLAHIAVPLSWDVSFALSPSSLLPRLLLPSPSVLRWEIPRLKSSRLLCNQPYPFQLTPPRTSWLPVTFSATPYSPCTSITHHETDAVPLYRNIENAAHSLIN